MNICEHCGKELNRKIFCNNSHRAMYYQRKRVEEVTKKVFDKKANIRSPGKHKELRYMGKPKHCKHGSQIGLCKYGCKK